MKMVSAAEMREIDRVTSERFGVPSLTLMENAGVAVANLGRAGARPNSASQPPTQLLATQEKRGRMVGEHSPPMRGSATLVDGKQLVAITTEWPESRELSADDFRIIIDPGRFSPSGSCSGFSASCDFNSNGAVE